MNKRFSKKISHSIFGNKSKTASVQNGRPVFREKQISLNRGDLVEVLAEQENGAFCIVEHTSPNENLPGFKKNRGFFPRRLLNMNTSGSLEEFDIENTKQKCFINTEQTALCIEILKVIREWNSKLSLINPNLLQKSSPELHAYLKMKDRIGFLISLRRKMMDLTGNDRSTEISRLTHEERVLKTIEEGRQDLGLDFVARFKSGPKKGEIIDENSASAYTFLKSLQMIEKKENLNKKKNQIWESVQASRFSSSKSSSKQKRDSKINHELEEYFKAVGDIHLLVSLKNLEIEYDQAFVFMTLFSRKNNQKLSEDFVFDVQDAGKSISQASSNPFWCLFKNLPPKKIMEEEISILLRIYTGGNSRFVQKLSPRGAKPAANSEKNNAMKTRTQFTNSENWFQKNPYGCAIISVTPKFIFNMLGLSSENNDLGTCNLRMWSHKSSKNFSDLVFQLSQAKFENADHLKNAFFSLSFRAYRSSEFKESIQNGLIPKNFTTTSLLDTKDLTNYSSLSSLRSDIHLALLKGIFDEKKKAVIVTTQLFFGTDGYRSAKPCFEINTNTGRDHSSTIYSSPIYAITVEKEPIALDEQILMNLATSGEDCDKGVILFVLYHHSTTNNRFKPFGFAVFPLKVSSTNSGGVGNVSGSDLMRPDADNIQIGFYKCPTDFEKSIGRYIELYLTHNANNSNSPPSGFKEIASKLLINFHVISTTISNNPSLNNLFRWNRRIQNIPTTSDDTGFNKKVAILKKIMNEVTYVDISTQVRYTREILNNAFSICLKNSQDQILKDEVFLFLINFLSNKCLQKNESMVWGYIEKYFNYPGSHKFLIESLKKFLTVEQENPEKNKIDPKNIQNALRSFHYLFCFIIKSRIQERKSETGTEGEKRFCEDMDSIFCKIKTIMEMNENTLIAAQEQILGCLRVIVLFPGIKEVLNESIFAKDVEKLVLSIPFTGRKNATQKKMGLIKSIVVSNSFASAKTKLSMLPSLLHVLEMHIILNPDEKKQAIPPFARIVECMQNINMESSSSGSIKNFEENKEQYKTIIHHSCEIMFLLIPFYQELTQQRLQLVKKKMQLDRDSLDRLPQDQSPKNFVKRVYSNGNPTGNTSNQNEIEIADTQIEDMDRMRAKFLSAVFGLFIFGSKSGINILEHYLISAKQPLIVNPEINSPSLNQLSETTQISVLKRASFQKFAATNSQPMKKGEEKQIIREKLHSFLNFLLEVIKGSPIPSHWTRYYFLQFDILMKTISSISDFAFKQFFQKSSFESVGHPDGNPSLATGCQIFGEIFSTIRYFCVCPFLQVEGYSTSKQEKILNYYGDLRVTMINFLLKFWKTFSDQHQFALIPLAVEPVLMIISEINTSNQYLNVGETCLELYFSMLETEFKVSNNFKTCEGTIYSVLDKLPANEFFRINFPEFFQKKINLMNNQLSNANFATECKRILHSIQKFIELSEKVRQTGKDEDENTLALLNVMNYGLSCNKMELFFKYAHILAKLHENNKNFVEAGLSLKLHYDKLTFVEVIGSKPKNLPAFNEFLGAQPEIERKIRLGEEIMKFFFKGKDWKRAVEISKELESVFKSNIFWDFDKVSEMLFFQSECYKNLAKTSKNGNPSVMGPYYFIGFYGNGFSDPNDMDLSASFNDEDSQSSPKSIKPSNNLYGNLKNKEFICKGNDSDRLIDFIEKITKRYPNAEIIKSMDRNDDPNGLLEKISNSDGQFIHITTVHPSSIEEMISPLHFIPNLELDFSSDNLFSNFEEEGQGKCFESNLNNLIHSKIKKIIRNMHAKQKNPNSRQSVNYAAPNPVSNPQKLEIFKFSKTFRKNPKDKKMNEHKDLFTRIEYLFINDTSQASTFQFVDNSFPSVARKKPIVKRIQFVLSPIENAIRNMMEKNYELFNLIHGVNDIEKTDKNALSMLLNGVIDAGVNGGIDNYINAFFTPNSNPEVTISNETAPIVPDFNLNLNLNMETPAAAEKSVSNSNSPRNQTQISSPRKANSPRNNENLAKKNLNAGSSEEFEKRRSIFCQNSALEDHGISKRKSILLPKKPPTPTPNSPAENLILETNVELPKPKKATFSEKLKVFQKQMFLQLKLLEEGVERYQLVCAPSARPHAEHLKKVYFNMVKKLNPILEMKI